MPRDFKFMSGNNTFSVSGIEEIKAKLSQLPGNLQKKVIRSAMRRGAEATAARAKELAPVDTGALRNSIRVQELDGYAGTFRVTAGAGGHDFVGDQYYAGMIEYGTKYIQARLFMTRAYEETAVAAQQQIEQDIIAGIEALLSE